MAPTASRDGLWRRASARWAEIGAISPDLLPAVTLQRELIRLMLDAADRLNQEEIQGLDPADVLDKRRRGVPALRNARVAIPASLKALVPAFCRALEEGGAGDSAVHIKDALLHGHMDAGSLVSVSLARDQQAIRTSALHMGFSPDLVWLVGELASAPLAHHLQTHSASGAQAATIDWNRGYCPFCGSWPAFVETHDGGRDLRCSFCALAWTLQSRRCIYCGDSGDGFITAAPDVSRSERRVELCAACGHYTKVMELAEPTPFPLLAIEDLASMDLDAGAMDRGYRRPELYNLDGIEPLRKTC